MIRLLKNTCSCIALLVILFAITACENNLEEVKRITTRSNEPTQTITSVEILYGDSGFVKAKITGPLLQRYITDTSSNVLFPKGIVVLVYDKQFKQTSSLRANSAINRERKKIMEARGNVIVINEKGEKLNTERLFWDENKEKIFSNEFVKITTPDKIIYGHGFESNQSFSKYKIFNITGTISVKNDKQ